MVKVNQLIRQPNDLGQRSFGQQYQMTIVMTGCEPLSGYNRNK